MINLFEYQNKQGIDNSFAGLEDFLHKIWQKRESYYFDSAEQSKNQKFIEFLNNSSEIKSRKYVGVIHYNDKKVNLLPKIFYDNAIDYTDSHIEKIHYHILWWLSYCRKIKFPNYITALSSFKGDFLEILIYLFAKYTRELFNSSIYQQYEEINREVNFIKGRLNVNEYINQNISTGRWHKLNCTYDSFVFDNEFNRIVKYVANLLYNATKNSDNKKYLREILFILDEVSDEKATAQQCSKIRFNQMFAELATVRDYCQLFLSNSISFNYKNDLRLFAFLLPMEYVFEDFLAGFISREIDSVNIKAQSSKLYLAEENMYPIIPDMLIETSAWTIIADAKYKIIYSKENDLKKSISQSDLYQMTAYAIRYNIQDVLLFYPNTINDKSDDSLTINIKDQLADGKTITIKIVKLPILDSSILHQEFGANQDLKSMFDSTRYNLVNELSEIFDTYDVT
jgi:5-methylcytosine-specific restriction enzyme subunit McrC